MRTFLTVIALSGLLVMNPACIIAYPLPSRSNPHSRNTLSMDDMKSIFPGRTNAEDVLLSFGEPEQVSSDGSQFAYRWSFEGNRSQVEVALPLPTFPYAIGTAVYTSTTFDGEFRIRFDSQRVVCQREYRLSGEPVMDDGRPLWMEREAALAQSAGGEHLVAVFVPGEDPRSGESREIEKALSEPFEHGVRFLVVRGAEAARETWRVRQTPSVIVLAPDGAEIDRAEPANARDVRALLDRLAARAPKRRPVSWEQDGASAPDLARREKKVLVIAFTVPTRKSAELLRPLEGTDCAILHDHLRFARADWKPESPEVRRWGATDAPMLVLVDPGPDAGQEVVMGRLSGWRTSLEVKAFLMKGLVKVARAHAAPQ